MELRFQIAAALEKATEAAHAMETAGRRWGRDSKELDLAIKAYENCLQDYYELAAIADDHWEAFCKVHPWREECRIYDC